MGLFSQFLSGMPYAAYGVGTRPFPRGADALPTRASCSSRLPERWCKVKRRLEWVVDALGRLAVRHESEQWPGEMLETPVSVVRTSGGVVFDADTYVAMLANGDVHTAAARLNGCLA